MNPDSRRLGTRISALHAATFVGIGFYLPFFPVWLQSRGLNPDLIGTVVALSIVVRIVVTAPLLSLADRSFGLRRLLLAGHAAQIVVVPLLLLTDNPWAIAVLVLLVAFAQAPLIPGNDLATTEAVRAHPRLDYGRMRVWGSIAFLVASVGAGYLVDATGPDAIVWAVALTPVLAIAATRIALPSDTVRMPLTARKAATRTKLPPLLIVIVAGAALIQSSHAALYAFGSIHWRSIGFSDSLIGYFWAIGVVAEIGVFTLLGRGVGRGSAGLGLIAIGGIAGIVRHGLLSTDPGAVPLLVLNAMHGLTFAATHLGLMATLAHLAPEDGRGRAQGVASSTLALSMAAMTMASGPLYRAIGPGVFAAMVPLCLAGLALVAVAWRMLKAQARRVGREGDQPHSSGEGG